MANEFKIDWEATPTDLTVTNLASLANGNLWQSGEINDADPSNEILRISYEIVFNATPVSGNSLRFYLAKGDQAASSEIWSGGIGTSEGQITTAAAVAELQAAIGPVYEHAWKTNHGATFQGVFDVYNFGPSWQLLVEANGEALASTGHTIRRRYGTFQQQ